MNSPLTPEARSAPFTILLVDDDPGILDSVADLLTFSGYHVLTANDGTTALPLMDEYLPDLIVSDITMQVMNGYEFFDAVRSNPRWAAIPFIFLTAKGQQKDIAIGQRMGVDAYLTKPFEPNELLLAIESRLKRAQQLTSLTEADLARLKHEIITVFSHELRTPLTYIVGYVTLLEDHRNSDPDSIDDMIVGVKRGADRLVSLVEDLMLMVRIDSGVVATDIAERRERVQLNTLINEVVTEYAAQGQARNVRVYSDCRDDITLPCMEYYVRDAICRIVSNAVKFSKREGGTVRVSVAARGDYAIITVEDNGIGIKPGQQKQLFERFKQLNREQMEQQGIGLGLTIARSLVRMHGGDIDVESAPGQGSRFIIRLPLYDEMIESALMGSASQQSILPSPVMSSD